MTPEPAMDRKAYLERIGLSPPSSEELNVQTIERLQQAHVRHVPFETLSITGDPFGEWEGARISLSVPDIYAKIVDRRRGGFCYELNGLFGWLLADLGFDTRRVSARIESDDGFGPPADHLTHVVELDDAYLVDVGFGLPKLRRPLPLSGESHVDEAGVAWRISDSQRSDADHAVEYRLPDRDRWATQCIFRDVPRTMDYFRATCEHFERAPDSQFTGNPIVSIATERGHSKLSPTTVTRSVGADSTQHLVDATEWYDLLDEEFGVTFPPVTSSEESTDPHSSAHSTG
jgi:N-hydroxyarylamine O-acetyltransferase